MIEKKDPNQAISNFFLESDVKKLVDKIDENLKK
jgi:hypothetical protein